MFEQPEKIKDTLRDHFYFLLCWMVSFWSGFALGFFWLIGKG